MNDMNNEKRINCHLEGRSPRQDLINKCKDCNNEIEQKAYRDSAKRDLYARSPNGSRLKMTEKALSLSGASSEPIISAESKKNQPMSLRGRAVGSDVVIFHAKTGKAQSFLSRCCTSEKQKESSLILRKAKFQAIFKFVLSSASGGAGGGKYNRISAFVSMPVLLIRRSLEKFFKKNFRDDSFTFGFAKVLALALLFTLATTAESWADESATTAEDTTQTQESQKLLTKEGDCGVGCKYEIKEENGKRNLYVYNDPSDPSYTGTANIAAYAFTSSYDLYGNHYNYYDNAKFDKITIDGNFDTIGQSAFVSNDASEVVFNGNIKNIGYGAFEFNNFTSVDLPEGLQTIGGEAFYNNSISSIVIPDSVKSIGKRAFHSENVIEVHISDFIENIGSAYPFGSRQRPNIFCKGDEVKCQSLVKNIKDYQATEPAGLENYVTGVDKDHCTGEKYFWNGTSCSRKESYCDKDMYYSGYECRMRPTDGSDIACDYEYSGWVKVGNNCYSPEVTYAKKHYTPAEANQWLRDGNDNFVVLTFKK